MRKKNWMLLPLAMFAAAGIYIYTTYFAIDGSYLNNLECARRMSAFASGLQVQELACPVTNLEYRISETDGVQSYSCPDPDNHLGVNLSFILKDDSWRIEIESNNPNEMNWFKTDYHTANISRDETGVIINRSPRMLYRFLLATIALFLLYHMCVYFLMLTIGSFVSIFRKSGKKYKMESLADMYEFKIFKHTTNSLLMFIAMILCSCLLMPGAYLSSLLFGDQLGPTKKDPYIHAYNTLHCLGFLILGSIAAVKCSFFIVIDNSYTFRAESPGFTASENILVSATYKTTTLDDPKYLFPVRYKDTFRLNLFHLENHALNNIELFDIKKDDIGLINELNEMTAKTR